MNYQNLLKLSKNELVNGLHRLDNVVCGPCQQGKLYRDSYKKISSVLMNWPVELLYMDLMGPSTTESLSGRRYIFCFGGWLH